MNSKISIFMSGRATSENTTFCVHEWTKIDLALKSQIFCLFYALKIVSLIYLMVSEIDTLTKFR